MYIYVDEDNPIGSMIEKLEVTAEYAARLSAVKTFNSANRWKKRGLSIVPMRYDHNLSTWTWLKYNCMVSVYGADGSVSVTHNGVEMGQGINTKVLCFASSVS